MESDLSAFHRIDDMHEMDSARFVRLAERLFAYKGVLRMKAEQEAEEQHRPDPPQHRPAAAPERRDRPARASRPAPGSMTVTELMIVNPGLIERVTV